MSSQVPLLDDLCLSACLLDLLSSALAELLSLNSKLLLELAVTKNLNAILDLLNEACLNECSEINYTTTGLVLLLALQSDIVDGRLDSGSVVGFYLPPETLVEIFPGTLHFAPCRVKEEGFNCLVVLEKGVNSPLSHVDTAAPGEEKMLWMRGKWMLCHPDSPQKQKGAYVGITGENLKLAI